jgi:hypothetical protein
MSQSFRENQNSSYPAVEYPSLTAETIEENHLPWAQIILDDSDFTDSPPTGDQILQHVIDTYEALPYILSPTERLMLKTNVISNHFTHVLNLPPMPRAEAEPGEWVLWAETNRKLTEKAARDIPDRQLGLRFASVMIPYNEATADYYEARITERQKLMQSYESYCSKHNVDIKAESLDYATVIWLDMECSTGYMTWRNAREALMHDVVLWQKITREDVAKQSPRYQAYIAAKLSRAINR